MGGGWGGGTSSGNGGRIPGNPGFWFSPTGNESANLPVFSIFRPDRIHQSTGFFSFETYRNFFLLSYLEESFDIKFIP